MQRKLDNKWKFAILMSGPVRAFFALRYPQYSLLSGNILNTEGVVLKMDMSKFFENIRISTQNSIMIPCKEALQLADYSVSLFSIQTHEK